MGDLGGIIKGIIALGVITHPAPAASDGVTKAA